MDKLTRECHFEIDSNMEKYEAIFCLLNLSMKMLTTESKKMPTAFKFAPRRIDDEIGKR